MVRLVCQQSLLTNDNLSKVYQRVLNLENSVTLNDKFEAAVVQIEKRIQDLSKIISEFQADSDKKFEKTPFEIKADIRDSQVRKKLIVIFGMPTTNNDTDSLRLLTEELGMDEIKVKKNPSGFLLRIHVTQTHHLLSRFLPWTTSITH
ncbi:unnamed protein product [Meganyctiphanes norvegica]|uniref:Uncharacterized protein n=1 Tax=Meganyctiphanes norvegica TaxID=48144 RepID=A0AAV2SL89_MEGNR